MNEVAYSKSIFDCETTKVRLRSLTADDEALFLSIYTNSQTMQMLGPAMSQEEARGAFLATLTQCDKSDPKCAFLAAESKRTEKPIGICAAPQIDLPGRCVEVGMMLLHKVQDRHLGQAAMTSLVRQVFAVLPVDEVWIRQLAKHRPARRLAALIGFKQCDRVDRDGGSTDMHFASILRHDWLSESTLVRKEPSV